MWKMFYNFSKGFDFDQFIKIEIPLLILINYCF